MRQDNILRMAQKAGFIFHDAGYVPEIMHTEPHEYSQKCFERFAPLVADAEREACAKVCEDKALEVSSGLHSQALNDYFDGYYFARAIRTRGINNG